jgi:hypothetical protein
MNPLDGWSVRKHTSSAFALSASLSDIQQQGQTSADRVIVVGFEVLTAVVMKTCIFWYITAV